MGLLRNVSRVFMILMVSTMLLKFAVLAVIIGAVAWWLLA